MHSTTSNNKVQKKTNSGGKYKSGSTISFERLLNVGNKINKVNSYKSVPKKETTSSIMVVSPYIKPTRRTYGNKNRKDNESKEIENSNVIVITKSLEDIYKIVKKAVEDAKIKLKIKFK